MSDNIDRMTEICPNIHDLPTTLLSSTLCIGLIISYLPQHVRIIRKKSSEGFSPWFLLLGATSSASGMLNVWILQWPLVKCCRTVSGGMCFENLLGLAQVTLQWLLFSVILVLYLIYFPHHLKFIGILPLNSTPAPGDADPGPEGYVVEHAETEERQPLLSNENFDDRGNGTYGDDARGGVGSRGETADRDFKQQVTYTSSSEWKLAVALAFAVAIHLTFLTFLTILLLSTLPSSSPPHPLLALYARFLGLSSTTLAVCQYAPQLYATYRHKLVGALSIGTMAIQTPGSVMFVISLAVREGVEWSSWLSYAVTGVMQGALLTMCLAWKQRQKKLGVDDFGLPLEQDLNNSQGVRDVE